MDGIAIPIPSDEEMPEFKKWLEKNKIVEFMHPDQHYDYVGAWRSGMNRGKEGHFFDTYKTPGHPTFSIESIYYKKGMPAGYWKNDKYIPIGR